MGGAKRWNLSRLIGIAIALAGLAAAAEGQGIQTAIEARGRVLPAVGPGVETLKQDAAGNYYVLAKPANVIWVYSSDGKLAGQIPNAHSAGSAIHYAVDFDISPEGKIVVADRGANAVEVFAPNGSPVARVAVNAPTSVVALSGGQFAVTSLTSKRLVQVLDEQGNYVRSFGDPTEVPQGSDRKALADLGRISGDSTGHIFFAFTTVADPTLRQYDRYGYVAYEAQVPEEYFEQLRNTPADRLEVAFNVGRYSLYDQSQAWVSLGSSGNLKYGGGVGPGLVSEFNRGGGGGGGFGRGGMRGQEGNLLGAPGAFPGGLGGGPVAGVFSGQMAPNGDSSVQFGMGSLSGGGRRGRGGGSTGDSSGSSASGVSLSFYGSQSRSGFGYDPDFMESYSPGSQDFSVPADTQSTLFGDDGLGSSQETYIPSATGQYGAEGGISGAFILGSTVNSFAYRGREGGGGFFGGGNLPAPSTGPLTIPGTSTGPPSAVSTPKAGAGSGAGAGPHEMGFESRYGHGHFGGGDTSVGASLRVNLGDLGTNVADKPIITAVAVDPATQEVWAGIGDTLVHFNKSGEPVEMFSLTLKGGARLHPTAILIEPNRFLIAADPWGIYEFAPPDGPAIGPAPTARVTATQTGASSATDPPKQ